MIFSSQCSLALAALAAAAVWAPGANAFVPAKLSPGRLKILRETLVVCG